MLGLNRLPELLGMPHLGRLPGLGQPAVRPADVGEGLRAAMLDRGSMLEDVNYLKVVPNRFIVEISTEDYRRQFRPIEAQVIDQWREQMLDDLITANSRQGRKEFRLGGRLQVEVRPSSSLKDSEARILSRIEPDPPLKPRPAARPVPPAQQPSAAPGRQRPVPHRQSLPEQAAASEYAETHPGPLPDASRTGQSTFLELLPSGKRWALYPGINTIGRGEENQIYLDMPDVKQRRLVSGQHAYIIMDQDECFLYDGSPDGRPSANGTYVNLRRVPPQGYRLQNGNAIVLAAIDPLYPRSDTPGVVTFYYWTGRRK